MAGRSYKSRNPIKLIAGVLFIVCLVITVSYSPLTDALDSAYRATGISARPVQLEGDLLVHFIDVGQADCTLVQTETKNILIDAGRADTQEQVLDYLKAQGVKQLDIVIVTHPHADHFGGMQYLIQNLPVKTALVSGGASEGEEQEQYELLLAAFEEQSAAVLASKPRTQFALEQDVTLLILGPLSDSEENVNNLSIISQIRHKDIAFLLTGDAEIESEDALVQAYGGMLKSDVLKLGHHGSKTSTQEKLLNAVLPEYAVASVGADGGYGHPHAEIIKRLQARDIALFRTDQDGTVVMASDGETITYSFAK